MQNIKYKSCIFFLADGARADVMRGLLDEGKLPNIRRYFLENGSMLEAVTSFPSTTGPAYLPFITGCFPGTCDMPGIRWLDKKNYKDMTFSLNRVRSYVGVESYLMNKDLRDGTKTIFHHLDQSTNIFGPITLGLSLNRNWSNLLKIPVITLSKLSGRWGLVDLYAAILLRGSIFGTSSMAPLSKFFFVVFPAIDELSHLKSPTSRWVIKAYQRIDWAVGLITKKLEQRGELKDVLMILASDHGLTETGHHFDLVKFLEERGLKTFHYPKVYKHWTNADASVMVSGNAMAHIYLNIQGGGGEGLSRGMEGKLSKKLIRKKEIDIVARRHPDGGIMVQSSRGEAIIKEEGRKILYESTNGDPFGFGDIPSNLGFRSSLEFSYRSNYPDVFVQILQIFRSSRCGDIVVSAHPNFDLRGPFEWPEHHASHGSLIREHMIVPLLFSCKIKEGIFRTVDVFPTILNLMGKETPDGIDGEGMIYGRI